MLIIPTALFVPLATLFAHNKVAVMAQLFLAMAVNSIADTSAYSGSNVIVRPLFSAGSWDVFDSACIQAMQKGNLPVSCAFMCRKVPAAPFMCLIQ